MKTDYQLGEDIFLACGTFFVLAAAIMKLFDFKINLGLSIADAKTVAITGAMCILLNIALNVQELTRK